MRTGGNLFHSTHVSQMTTAVTTATFSPPATIQRSPWHSPVPYLFGGLAAMLGLIAFALLMLACSYWKLSGQVNGEEGGDRDDKWESGPDGKAMPVFEEKFLVIMAGDLKPTFLATPMSSTSRASSFSNEKINDRNENEKEEKSEDKDQIIHENGELGESTRTSHEQSH